MFEILEALEPESRVLDLGSGNGSFPAGRTAGKTIRYDIAFSGASPDARVQGAADRLPFRARAFDAVICNHGLEHFSNLNESLREVGRVLTKGGALYIAVPDASAFTDRLYRWLARGGGHINPFVSASELEHLIASQTGLRHLSTGPLYSSLSFLNRRNSPRPIPLRLLPLGYGYEWSLFLYVLVSRWLDRTFGTRTSIYGWKLYFGTLESQPDLAPRRNVCIRCGAGSSAEFLVRCRSLLLRWHGPNVYRCPHCNACNPLIRST